MKRALLGLVLVLSACGVVRVGDACEARTDCATPLDCFPAPGGFCTRGCAAEGGIQDCPGGTICTYFGPTELVCSTYCNASSDCRVNFECAAVVGSDKKACRPEGITR